MIKVSRGETAFLRISGADQGWGREISTIDLKSATDISFFFILHVRP